MSFGLLWPTSGEVAASDKWTARNAFRARSSTL